MQNQEHKPEELPCPLFNKKCSEINTPETKCGWFIPVLRPHPQIAGQVMQGRACKLDVLLMLLADLSRITSSMLPKQSFPKIDIGKK